MGTAITLVIITIAGLAVWLMITRGLQLKQLVEDGIDTEGKIIRQFRRNPKKASLSTDFFLRYVCRDRNGIEHVHKANVNRDFWTAYPEGSAIMITHSKSRPGINAPRFQVDAAREAVAKKKNWPSTSHNCR